MSSLTVSLLRPDMDLILQATTWEVIAALNVSGWASDHPTYVPSRAGQNLTGSTVTSTSYHCEIMQHSRLWFCLFSATARSLLEHGGPGKGSFLVFSLCRTRDYPTWSVIPIHHTTRSQDQFEWSHATVHFHLFWHLSTSFSLHSHLCLLLTPL